MAGRVTGYASVTGVIDRVGDVVLPGAFLGLERLVRDGFVAVGHEWTRLPVGWIVAAVEDARGLKVTLAFHETEEGRTAEQMVRERIAAGKTVGLSIGYVVRESARGTWDGERVRLLRRIEVREVSLVGVPANPAAVVTQYEAGATTLGANKT